MNSDSGSEERSLQQYPEHPIESDIEISPSETIEFHMAIPEECKSFLDSYLKPLGFSTENSYIDEEIPDRKTIIYFTLLSKSSQEVKRFLLHFKKSELDLATFTGSTRDKLLVIRELLTMEQTSIICIYIIYKEEPHLAYRILMEVEWLERISKIKTIKFVSASSVSDIDAINAKKMSDIEYPMRKFWKKHMREIEDYLYKLLDLDIENQLPTEQESSQSKRDISEIPSVERRRLIKIISKMPNFEEPRSRRSFVRDFAGIDMGSSFQFDGDKLTFASALVGKIVDDNDKQKFISLLEALCDHDEIDNNDKIDFLKPLSEQYSFVE